MSNEIKIGDRVARLSSGRQGVVRYIKVQEVCWEADDGGLWLAPLGGLRRIAPERKPGDVVPAKHDYGDGLSHGHYLLLRVADGWLSYNSNDDRPREVYFLRDEDISDE